MNVKKLIIIICISLLMLNSISFGDGKRIGDKINEVLATDIKAYVNEKQIPSMNIDGKTAIVAEDLRNYGFDVVWNPDNRTLRISENINKKMNPLEVEPKNNVNIGEVIKDVLYTDIKTYINNQEVESFNIDGYTAIYIDALDEYGSITWSNEKRVIRFESQNRKSIDENDNLINEYNFIIKNKNDIEMDIKFTDEGMLYLDNQKIGFSINGIPYLSLSSLGESFNYNVTNNQNYYKVQKGSYAFEIQKGTKIGKIFYDNKLITQFENNFNSIEKYDDLYISQYDLKDLFGYATSWDNDSRVLNILYSEYGINYYGSPSQASDQLILTAKLVDEDNKFIIRESPTLRISNKFENTSGKDKNRKFSGSTFINRVDGARIYKLESETYINIGDNLVEIKINVGGRILFYMEKEVTGDLALKALETNYLDIDFNKPEKGYTEIHDFEYEIKGNIQDTTEDTLVLIKEKLDDNGYFDEVSRDDVIIINNEFNHMMDFKEGPGIYKISLLKPVVAPHAQALVLVTSFYINVK